MLKTLQVLFVIIVLAIIARGNGWAAKQL